MRRIAIVAASVGLSVAGVAAYAQNTSGATSAPSSKLSQFLTAADKNDFVTMSQLIAGDVTKVGGGQLSSASFFKEISSCYLRRVYRGNQAPGVIAAWMCAEGEAKSRVIVADLIDAPKGVLVIISRDDHNDRPAPARSGSAFAPDAM